MCLTIPGKILSIEKGMAKVKNGAEIAEIDLGLVFGAKKGDWILYATDRAVKKISATDAKEIIDLLESKYQRVDNDKLPKKLKDIIFEIRTGGDISKEDIEYLLNLKEEDELTTLYSEANTLRKTTLKDFVCIHGIIEFSNYCKNNCLYCGIRKDNTGLTRYRMAPAEIEKAAALAIEKEGYKLIVLQSGEDLNYSDRDLIEIIKSLKKNHKVFIFLSVGERSEDFYKKAFRAGAHGSLFRFETSNPKLYEKMHPGHTLKERIDSLKMQKKIGYYIASGSLVGLPEQTVSDIADDILMIKKLSIPMISSGPWIPTENTPLANSKFDPLAGGLNSKQTPNIKSQITNEDHIEQFLKYIAVVRLTMPEIKIPVTTALETLDPENGRHRGLLAGANALMFNLTPARYCKNYNIYDNKYVEREKVWQKYGLFKGEESWEMLEEQLKI
jgi:biotin synthase